MAKLGTVTDRLALTTLGTRLASRRLERNQTQEELARAAGVSKRTLNRIEGGESTQLTNLIRVLRALGLMDNLELLVPATAASPIAQLRSRGRERKRATPRSSPGKRAPLGEWTWGEDAQKPGKSP